MARSGLVHFLFIVALTNIIEAQFYNGGRARPFASSNTLDFRSSYKEPPARDMSYFCDDLYALLNLARALEERTSKTASTTNYPDEIIMNLINALVYTATQATQARCPEPIPSIPPIPYILTHDLPSKTCNNSPNMTTNLPESNGQPSNSHAISTSSTINQPSNNRQTDYPLPNDSFIYELPTNVPSANNLQTNDQITKTSSKDKPTKSKRTKKKNTKNVSSNTTSNSTPTRTNDAESLSSASATAITTGSSYIVSNENPTTTCVSNRSVTTTISSATTPNRNSSCHTGSATTNSFKSSQSTTNPSTKTEYTSSSKSSTHTANYDKTTPVTTSSTSVTTYPLVSVSAFTDSSETPVSTPVTSNGNILAVDGSDLLGVDIGGGTLVTVDIGGNSVDNKSNEGNLLNVEIGGSQDDVVTSSSSSESESDETDDSLITINVASNK